MIFIMLIRYQETNNSICTHEPGLGINGKDIRSVKRSLNMHSWKRNLTKLKMAMSQKQDPKEKYIALFLDKRFLDTINKNCENGATWEESSGTSIKQVVPLTRLCSTWM